MEQLHRKMLARNTQKQLLELAFLKGIIRLMHLPLLLLALSLCKH